MQYITGLPVIKIKTACWPALFQSPKTQKKRPASEEAERLVTSFYSSISIPQVRVKVIRSFAWTVMLSTSAAH